MFVSILTISFITCILCNAMMISTSGGMFLEKLGVYGDTQLKKGHIWVKPLFMCAWCMPSVWTVFGYFFAFILGVVSLDSWPVLLLVYPLSVCMGSMFSGILWTIINLLLNFSGYIGGGNAEHETILKQVLHDN